MFLYNIELLMSCTTMSSLNPCATRTQPTGTQSMGNYFDDMAHMPSSKKHAEGPSTWNLERIAKAAREKSKMMSRTKCTTPLFKVILQNLAVTTLNDCLTTHWRSSRTEFIGDHLLVPFLYSIRAPLIPAQIIAIDNFPIVASEDLSEQFSEDLSEQFSVIGEETPEALNEAMMESAFDGAYALPTQPSFDMSQPELSNDVGDCGVLSQNDEQQLEESLCESSTDPIFDTYLTAVIHATGLIHAMHGTTPSFDEFFALQALWMRACSNTSTQLDRDQIAYLMSILRKDIIENG